GGNLLYEWKGVWPSRSRTWAYVRERMKEFDDAGLIFYTKNGVPRMKEYLSEIEGAPVQSIWSDEEVRYIVSWTSEGLGYPTQKSVGLLSRIIAASCPPGGLVL